MGRSVLLSYNYISELPELLKPIASTGAVQVCSTYPEDSIFYK